MVRHSLQEWQSTLTLLQACVESKQCYTGAVIVQHRPLALARQSCLIFGRLYLQRLVIFIKIQLQHCGSHFWLRTTIVTS